MKLRLPLLLLFISLFLLTGALGLKSQSECDSQYTRPAPRMQCYHTAAVTAAYLGDETLARSICSDIWYQFSGSPDGGNDLRRRAELSYNSCYYDIARILRNPALCDSIQKRDNLGQALVGEEVTQDACYDEATKLAQLAPEYYYQNNPDSLCTMFFVLPALLLAVIRSSNP